MTATYRAKTGKHGVSYSARISDIGNLVVTILTKHAAHKGIAMQHAATHFKHTGKVLVHFED